MAYKTKAQLKLDEKRKKHAKELREERALIKELGLKEVFRKEGMIIQKPKGKNLVKKWTKVGTQKRVVGRLFGVPSKQAVKQEVMRVVKEVKRTKKVIKADLARKRKEHAEALAQERKQIKRLGLKEVYRKEGMTVKRVTRGLTPLGSPRAYGTRKRVVGRLFA